jgi:hypothetical protein
MKRVAIIATFLILLAGCAFVQKQYDYTKLCANDPACLAEAKKDAETWKSIAGMAYPIAAIPVGAFSMTIALWLHGKRKKV